MILPLRLATVFAFTGFLIFGERGGASSKCKSSTKLNNVIEELKQIKQKERIAYM